MKLINRPPCLGPEPKREVPTCIVSASSRDLPESKKKSRISSIEQSVIDDIVESIKNGKALIDDDIKNEVDSVLQDIKSKNRKKSKFNIEGTWSCNYNVCSVSELTLPQAIEFLSGRRGNDESWNWCRSNSKRLTVVLNYPMSRPVEVKIEPVGIKYGNTRRGGKSFLKEMNFGYVLWVLAQEYKKIYDLEHKTMDKKAKRGKYGIWGHCLGDLYFEGLIIKKNGKTEALIGS